MVPFCIKKRTLLVGIVVVLLCIALYQWNMTGLLFKGKLNSLQEFDLAMSMRNGTKECRTCGHKTNAAKEGVNSVTPVKRISSNVTSLVTISNTNYLSQNLRQDKLDRMKKILNILTNRKKRDRNRRNHILRQCSSYWQNSYKKLHDDILHSRRPPKFLIYHCGGPGHGCGSYGDRMEAIASVFFMAVLTRRAFLIHWNTSAPIEEFLQPININWNASIAHFHGLRVQRHYWGIGNHDRVTADVKRPTLNSSTFLNWLREVDFRTYFSSPIEVITSVWYFAPDLQKNKYLSEVAESLKVKARGNRYSSIGCAFRFLFRKRPELNSRLSHAKYLLDLKPEFIKIGINIRMADTKTQALFDFFECAKALQDSIVAASSKISAKEIKWFLASDNKHVKSYAQRKYHDKVVTLPVKIEHIAIEKSSHRGMLGILIDNFILSECDFLITALNSFGKTALGLSFASERFTKLNDKCAYLTL